MNVTNGPKRIDRKLLESIFLSEVDIASALPRRPTARDGLIYFLSQWPHATLWDARTVRTVGNVVLKMLVDQYGSKDREPSLSPKQRAVRDGLVGRTIRRVEMHPFERDEGALGDEPTDPVIIFDDGSRLAFVVHETEDRYGVHLVYSAVPQ